MMQQREPSQEPTDPDFEPLSSEEQVPITRRKKVKNKKRFSDEQVRSLETIFASETKLEPKKKVQVARELGLQPRQVAIWFQNKRARWKSKQIEKDYRTLKANYDNLKARFEAVRKEKQSLLEQLQELRSHSEKFDSQYIRRENREAVEELLPVKACSLQEEMDHQGMLYSDDDWSGNMAQFDQEEPELINISDNIDVSTISPVKWCSLDAGSLFDLATTSSFWWDSWT